MTDEGTRSRRERPAKPALTRDGIVATAVRLMRAEGLARVTMRRLAQELDTGPASLYVYVRNTAELHAAVLDELLGELAPAGSGRWDERLVGLLTDYTGLLFAQPSLARAALSARPSGPHYLRLVESVLALLTEGGVPGPQAAWGVDVLLQFGTATAAEQSDRDTSAEAGQEWDALTGALRGASADRYPQLAAWGPALLSGTPEGRLGWGFRVLIHGIAETPLPE